MGKSNKVVYLFIYLFFYVPLLFKHQATKEIISLTLLTKLFGNYVRICLVGIELSIVSAVKLFVYLSGTIFALECILKKI